MTNFSAASYDYIVVGGGIGGCVVASRLREKLPDASILLLEAGKDPVGHPLTSAPLACFGTHHSELDWDLSTVPQPHLDNRTCYQAAAKGLGGGSSINYATWLRGPKVDYDRWAKLVDDDRWSYDGLLRYFERHGGANGKIKISSTSQSHPDRKYPLRDLVRSGWESEGVPYNPTPKNGDPLGITELVENWDEGKRQFAHMTFNLDGVDIITEAPTARILLSKSDSPQGHPRATGVQLLDGRTFSARKEVIASCGTYHTPKLLLLSGIGPKDELKQHGIDQIVDAPEVGRNFHDHPAVALIWKLKKEQLGLPMSAIGSNPAFGLGLPADWVVFSGLNKKTLSDALAKDGLDISNPKVQYLLDEKNCFTETLNVYAPAGAMHADMDIPFDGLHISTPVLGMLPTSRGSISLSSNDPTTSPRIDPNYYATEVDRAIMRSGIRQALQVFQESAALKDVIATEVPPKGYPVLSTKSSDEEIDARVRRVANTFFHPAGSCAMGKAVDSELRVNGVDGLRVVDASVLPTPVAAHYQYCIYTVAERAADFIVEAKQ
ncbi:GMC oxidoreductase [Penicillium hetheringtonii]|uniref:GMC oxidoreductase n=1 Tax=Penicillium hetheringtonii TaxID=911720 RepID=A0AAD6DT13_9EURO|nr:GMC oxidoreductase [Penicillium hetheringtonii]